MGSAMIEAGKKACMLVKQCVPVLEMVMKVKMSYSLQKLFAVAFSKEATGGSVLAAATATDTICSQIPECTALSPGLTTYPHPYPYPYP